MRLLSQLVSLVSSGSRCWPKPSCRVRGTRGPLLSCEEFQIFGGESRTPTARRMNKKKVTTYHGNRQGFSRVKI